MKVFVGYVIGDPCRNGSRLHDEFDFFGPYTSEEKAWEQTRICVEEYNAQDVSWVHSDLVDYGVLEYELEDKAMGLPEYYIGARESEYYSNNPKYAWIFSVELYATFDAVKEARAFEVKAPRCSMTKAAR